jgi:hypothetical protein
MNCIVGFGPASTGKSLIFREFLQQQYVEKLITIDCNQLNTLQTLLWTIQTLSIRYLERYYRWKKLSFWRQQKEYSIVDLMNFYINASSNNQSNQLMMFNNNNNNKNPEMIEIPIFLDNFHHLPNFSNIFTNLISFLQLQQQQQQSSSFSSSYSSTTTTTSSNSSLIFLKFFITIQTSDFSLSTLLFSQFIYFPKYTEVEIQILCIQRLQSELKLWQRKYQTSNHYQKIFQQYKIKLLKHETLFFQTIGTYLCQLYKTLFRLCIFKLYFYEHNIDIIHAVLSSLWMILYNQTIETSYETLIYHYYQHIQQHQNENETTDNSTEYQPQLIPIVHYHQIMIEKLVLEMLRLQQYQVQFPLSYHRSPLSTTNNKTSDPNEFIKGQENEEKEKVNEADSNAWLYYHLRHIIRTLFVTAAATTITTSTTTTTISSTVSSSHILPTINSVNRAINTSLSSSSISSSFAQLTTVEHYSYLLIAAFLATERNQQEDHHHYTSLSSLALSSSSSSSTTNINTVKILSKRQKRKVANHQDDDDHPSSSNRSRGKSGSVNSSSNNNSHSTNPNQAGKKNMSSTLDIQLPNQEWFSMERLLSIYSHIYSYCAGNHSFITPFGPLLQSVNNQNHTIQQDYHTASNHHQSFFGASLLHSWIAHMITQDYLEVSSAYTQHHMQRKLHLQFKSKIPKELAKYVAQQIKFPLEEFLTVHHVKNTWNQYTANDASMLL